MKQNQIKEVNFITIKLYIPNPFRPNKIPTLVVASMIRQLMYTTIY